MEKKNEITREMRLKHAPKNYEDKNIKAIGRLLSSWRLESNYPIADIADFLGTTSEEVIDIENGVIVGSKKFLSYLLLADFINI